MLSMCGGFFLCFIAQNMILVFSPKLISPPDAAPNGGFPPPPSLPIVIDSGSAFFKAGTADVKYPKSIFSNVIGKPFYPPSMIGMEQKELRIVAS